MTPMINGFQGRYMQNFGNDSQFGATTGVTLRRPEIREFGASFAQGPISLAAAHLTSTTSPNEPSATANVKTTTMTLSAAYTAGPLRVGAGMSNIENNAAAKLETSAWMIAGQYQMGAIRLMANYGNRKTDASSVASNVGQKSKLLGLAAEYDLSKRTYVYARISDQDMKDGYASSLVVNGAAVASRTDFNPDVKVIGVGISHQF
jgi:predicted porin